LLLVVIVGWARNAWVAGVIGFDEE